MARGPASDGTGREITNARLQLYQGVLPHPDILERYEAIHKGSTAQIMKMAEDQAVHRQYIEKIAIATDGRKSSMGTLSGLAVAITAIIGAVICAVYHAQLTGCVLGGGTLVSLVSVFLKEKTRIQSELERKRPPPIREQETQREADG